MSLVTLNCTWDEFGVKTYTCPGGRSYTLECDGIEKSRTYMCGETNQTVCGVWNGTAWDDSTCILEMTQLYETTCTCYNLGAIGAGDDTAEEIFLDFAALASSIAAEFLSTLKMTTLLSPAVIAKNIVIFVTIGKSCISILYSNLAQQLVPVWA